MYALRVTVAAACAALIGSALALYYLPVHFWWVGAIAGGAVGWVGYDVKAFLQSIGSAIASAWHEMTRERERKPKRVYPAWAKRATRWDWFSTTLVWMTLIGYAGAAFEITSHHNLAGGEMPSTIMQVFANYLVVSILLSPIAAFMSLGQVDNFAKSEKRGEDMAADHVAMSKKIAFFGNPIAAPFALVYFVLFMAIPWTVKFIGHVFVKIYQFTTSDGRIASLIGGSMGTVAGYFLGNPFMGALVGAGVGLTLALTRPKGARVKS